jgi:hypothetical protein
VAYNLLFSSLVTLGDSSQSGIRKRAEQGKVYRAAYTYFFTKNVGGQIVEPLRDLLEEWKARRDELVRKVNGGDLTALDDLPRY